MDIKSMILQVGLVALTLFFIWVTWRGLRTGAVDTRVKGSSVPVYAYRDKNRSHIAVIIALPSLLYYLFCYLDVKTPA